MFRQKNHNPHLDPNRIRPSPSVAGITPEFLGSNLLAWWNADRTDLITLSSTKVTSWRDSVGGLDAAQGTDGNRPIWSATSFNNRAGVTFDGTDDYLNVASVGTLPTGAGEAEVWIVLQQNAGNLDTAARIAFSYGGTTNGSSRKVYRDDTSAISRMRTDTGDGAAATAVIDTDVEANYRHVVRAQFMATATDITVDGITPVTGAVVPATGTTRIRMGSNTAASPSAFWKGQIREIIVTKPLTAAAAAVLYEYLSPRRELDLVPFVNYETILNSGAGTNTGTDLGTAPTYLYSLADEASWDSRASTLATRGDSYLAQGRTNTANSTNCRNWLVSFATQSAMRLTLSTTFVDGAEADYVSSRNWATAMYGWAYLKTRGATVYSDADHALIKAWFAGISVDIQRYYQYTTDTLGSKQNNHLGFAILANALCAVICNDRTSLNWSINGQKHIMNDSMADTFVKEDSIVRPMMGYNPDAGNLMPTRAMLMLDLDRAVSATQHDGVFYNWYHKSNMAVTALLARANGVNLLTFVGTNAGWTNILDAYKAICDDAGLAVFNFIVANDVDSTITLSTHLNVATHKVDQDVAGFRLLTATNQFSAHAAAATINTNLTGKTNNILGGDLDYIRSYMT